MLGGFALALLELLAPQGGEGHFLGPIDGDGITVVDSVGSEFLLADELIDQTDLGLFDLTDIDGAQQPKEGVGMGDVLKFREQAPQVLFKHRGGDLPIGLAS